MAVKQKQLVSVFVLDNLMSLHYA